MCIIAICCVCSCVYVCLFVYIDLLLVCVLGVVMYEVGYAGVCLRVWFGFDLLFVKCCVGFICCVCVYLRVCMCVFVCVYC